jgi:hypothetical protein
MGNLTLGLELFYCKNLRVLILQQRAPFLSGFNRLHAQNISEWCKSVSIPTVIVLASEFSHVRNDELLNYDFPSLQDTPSDIPNDRPNQASTGIHVAIDENWINGIQVSEHLRWKRHLPPPTPTSVTPADSNSNNNDDDDENDGLTSRKIKESNKSWLPGGASTHHLLPALSKLYIPNATVWVYTAEGDNIQDSLLFGTTLVEFITQIESNLNTISDASSIDFNQIKWQVPLSWSSMFGPPHEPDVYLH